MMHGKILLVDDETICRVKDRRSLGVAPAIDG